MYSIQYCCSLAQLCLTLCSLMDCSTPGFPVHDHLPEFAQTHAHWVDDAIQPSCLLLSPSPPALYLSQHQGLFSWVSSSHQVTKIWELQLQHHSFQWTCRVDFLLDWLLIFDWVLISLQSKGLKSLLQHQSSKVSILWCSAFFMAQLSHPYMITGKTITLTRWTSQQSTVSAF